MGFNLGFKGLNTVFGKKSIVFLKEVVRPQHAKDATKLIFTQCSLYESSEKGFNLSQSHICSSSEVNTRMNTQGGCRI